MFEQQQNTGKSASLAEKYANAVASCPMPMIGQRMQSMTCRWSASLVKT